MNTRNAVYWTATALTAFTFLTGGAAYIWRADFAVPGIIELGYPVYFITLLGIGKFLGGLVIVAPGLPRLKEWAYAGIVFDLTGAAFSHAAIGNPAAKIIVPLGLLGIAATSWALRPASRTLAAVADVTLWSQPIRTAVAMNPRQNGLIVAPRAQVCFGEALDCALNAESAWGGIYGSAHLDHCGSDCRRAGITGQGRHRLRHHR